MSKVALTPELIVEVLNEFVKLDREAAHALVETRVACNKAVEDHETIPVSGEGPGGRSIGILGLLNGIVGHLGLRIFGHYDEDDKLEYFSLGAPHTPPIP